MKSYYIIANISRCLQTAFYLLSVLSVHCLLPESSYHKPKVNSSLFDRSDTDRMIIICVLSWSCHYAAALHSPVCLLYVFSLFLGFDVFSLFSGLF